MATDLSVAPPAPAAAPAAPEGFDRALLLSLAKIPFLAVLWTAAAWAASAAVEAFGWHLVAANDAGELLKFNLGPLFVIGFGMLLAAWIDGYYFKVPNWCTLSLVMSGWYVGLLHDLAPGLIPGVGGVGAALAGTVIGFLLLFPALFIRGMGEGDVKMTMGFASWVFAYFGGWNGASVLGWSFAWGVIVGGVFGLVMMALRRQIHKNLSNTREIFQDLRVLVTEGPGKAADRANSRRKDWVRLPYGVPLCVGFIGYVAYGFYDLVMR